MTGSGLLMCGRSSVWRSRSCLVACLATACLCHTGLAVLVDNPTTYWTPISYPNNNYPDPFNDEQATSDESDIVGDIDNPSFYMSFDNGGTPGILTDGTLAFRARMAGGDAIYNRLFFVGIDTGQHAPGATSADMDLFVGVDNKANPSILEIDSAGTGANISPSTTTITPYPSPQTYPQTAANYLWGTVTTALDPTATTLNVDGGSNTDYFLSFAIPFADIVARLNEISYISNIDETTPLTFIAATATQDNSLNQDLNGVGNLSNAEQSLTWAELGVQSDPFAPSALAPEPGSFGLLMISSLLVMMRRRS